MGKVAQADSEQVGPLASATVVKEYLQALVQADDIFAMGVSGLA